MNQTLRATIVALMGLLFATGCPDTNGEDASSQKNPQDPNCEPTTPFPTFGVESFAGDPRFNDAVGITQAPGNDDAFFVIERKGQIVVIDDGSVRSEPFLDIEDQVVSGYGEQGLLGLAFHPDYQDNGRFFIAYTSKQPRKNVVAEYRRQSGAQFRADPNEVQRLVDIDDPRKQHNGGTLAFGPDGYLYAALGNGGAGQKKKHGGIGRAQYTQSVFGTLMRMDVDRPDANFAVPENPFAGDDTEGDGRIFAYGLRNAWQFTVDSKTGDLFISDVGKQSWEEINYIPANSDGGQNFGWPAYHGEDTELVTSAKKAVETHAKPISTYAYKDGDAIIRDGCSIIGGRVYRGDAMSSVRGYYIYGDLCTNDMAALKYCDTDDPDAKPEVVDHERIADVKAIGQLRAITSDNAGELYLVGAQKIRRLVTRP